MKNVLIVDDEKNFLLSLSDGLSAYASDFNVLTAGNGKEAVEVLESNKVDLVVTDLKMPRMDGFELLMHINMEHPTIPVIVMTAFGTPEIEDRTENLGAVQYLEKPLDFTELADKIFDGLAAGSKGYIQGISLSSFLQLVEMEKKTCTLTIRSGDEKGLLFFLKGVLIDAETGKLKDKEAAYEIVCWENAEIEINHMCKRRKNRINTSLNHILMESFRLKDEALRDNAERRTDKGTGKVAEEGEPADIDKTREIEKTIQKEVNIMAVQDRLKEFAAIEGFAGVAIFTPTGEALAMLEGGGSKASLKEVGILANNVLLNAQKASLDMGAGRGQLVHIEAEKAHIVVRCLNEGTDPLKSQPGKAHIHLVLVLTSDSSIGLAKLKVNAIAEGVAAEFRL